MSKNLIFGLIALFLIIAVLIYKIYLLKLKEFEKPPIVILPETPENPAVVVIPETEEAPPVVVTNGGCDSDEENIGGACIKRCVEGETRGDNGDCVPFIPATIPDCEDFSPGPDKEKCEQENYIPNSADGLEAYVGVQNP